MELLSIAVAAGISTFTTPVPGPQGLNGEGSPTALRRCCVCVIRHVCVILTGIGLQGESVTDEMTLEALFKSCSTFLSLSLSYPTGGAIIEAIKNHHNGLLVRGKTKILRNIQMRKHLTDSQRSNARKLIRFIKKNYMDEQSSSTVVTE